MRIFIAPAILVIFHAVCNLTAGTSRALSKGKNKNTDHVSRTPNGTWQMKYRGLYPLTGASLTVYGGKRMLSS